MSDRFRRSRRNWKCPDPPQLKMRHGSSKAGVCCALVSSEDKPGTASALIQLERQCTVSRCASMLKVGEMNLITSYYGRSFPDTVWQTFEHEGCDSIVHSVPQRLDSIWLP